MKAAKNIIFFIIFQLIFCSILGIILVFHGPFTNIKETFVTSAMSTMSHQYLAKLFLSQDEIDSIMVKARSGNRQESEKSGDVTVSKDSNNIEIIDIKTNKFKGYIMVVDNPSRIRVGSPESLGESGMTLSQIVKQYDAAGGINAGGFSDATGAGTGGVPQGILVEDNTIKYKDKSSSYNIIGFDKNDVLVIGDYTLDRIEREGIRDAVCFGPPLIINGKPMITSGNGGWGIQPRTAIAQRQDGTVLLMVIDGRQKDSIGATLKDEQDILMQYGAYNAANLDGGSSSTMYYDGKVVNSPSDILGERSLASAFIVR